MAKQYESQALAMAHETAQGLANAGVMAKRTMKAFDETYLTPVEDMPPEKIRALRPRPPPHHGASRAPVREISLPLIRCVFSSTTLPHFVMPGLVPGIHGLHHGDMRKGGGWVYIMTNRPNGTLYLGVTSDIARRAWQHREGLVEGFTKRYGLSRLVYAERHDDIAAAIQRERTMKHWPRAWKVNLIVAQNPDWDDLYETLP